MKYFGLVWIQWRLQSYICVTAVLLNMGVATDFSEELQNMTRLQSALHAKLEQTEIRNLIRFLSRCSSLTVLLDVQLEAVRMSDHCMPKISMQRCLSTSTDWGCTYLQSMFDQHCVPGRHSHAGRSG